MRSKLLLLVALSLILSFDLSYSRQKQKKTDPELLKVLLTIFLGNNDLKNAFDVAKRGKEKYPSDPFWWEWYAKINLWLGRYDEAVSAQLKLLEMKPSRELIKTTLKISLDSRRYDVASKLISDNIWLAKDYSPQDIYFIFVNAGDINRMVSVFEKLYDEEAKLDYLYFSARALFMYGDLKKAEDYLKKIKALKPLTVEEILLYSDILTAENRLEENYRLLLSYFQNIKPAPDDETVNYFQRLSSLAWSNNDIETSAKASEVLISLEKAQEADFVRLYFFYALKGEYRKAAQIAEKGYAKTSSEYLFILWVEALNSMNDWGGVIEAFKLRKPDELLKNTYLLSLYLRALYRSEQRERARALARSFLKMPSTSVLSVVIYAAVDHGDWELGEEVIRRFRFAERELPKEFALLYLSRQEGNRARILLESLKEKDREDLIIYSYALNVAGRQEEAQFIRSTVAREIYQEREPLLNEERIRLMLMSGIGLMPWIRLQDALRAGEDKLKPEVWQDFYLSNLFANSFYERAQFARSRQKMDLKPWMELALALWSNNKDDLQRLLEKEGGNLPLRDTAQAYQRLGARFGAMEQLQVALEKNPDDALAYELLRQLSHEHASEFLLSSTYRSLEKVDYQTFDLSLRLGIHDRMSLFYHLESGFLVRSNSKLYTNLPGNYYYSRLYVRRYTSRGYFQLGSFAGEGLRPFVGFEMGASSSFFRNNTTLSAFYNRPAVESLALQLGALKDGLSIGLFKNITPRTWLGSTMEYSLFKAQDSKRVGWGLSGYTELSHRMRFAYPDYTFKGFFTFGSYEQSDSSGGALASLFAAPSTRIMPQDSFTVGAGFNFGLNPKESISRFVVPFADLELFYNSRAEMGYGFSLGLTGRLLGRDTLTLGFKRFSNFRTTGGSLQEPFMRYRLLF